LCMLLVVEALAYFFIVPCMGAVKIAWHGLSNYTVTDMSTVIAPVVNKNWMQFNREEAQSLVASVPGIEDAQVIKRFPDRVFIKVVERTPVAMTFVSLGERTVPVQLDKHGVLFPATRAQASSGRLPLVSGIPVENIPEGMRIPQKYLGLMEQIAAIKALPQDYFAAVSEIHVVPKEYGNYELVLYPIHSKVRILTDRQLNEDALQYMIVMLDVVNAIEPDVAEIDLRYGSFSYRARERDALLGEKS
ncbi:MAG: FtsQ-type POTRA domain-containing protein, partial [Treponema sp.]|nr:FtsQ-type POTRA domain-containing protein [Treponema sp.]